MREEDTKALVVMIMVQAVMESNQNDLTLTPIIVRQVRRQVEKSGGGRLSK
jgi:hypothetical protein